MSLNSKNLVIGVVPEGPIAFDGRNYRYSKGERQYLDNLANYFSELILITFVLRKGDPFYESCIHSPFTASNIKAKEMPGPKNFRTSVLGKLWQFLKVFVFLLKVVPKVDVLYIFLPSYPGALSWVVAKIFRKVHIVYGADDWEQASESMFKWRSLKNSWFYSLYLVVNRWMERRIVETASFSVVAGGQLKAKYNEWGCSTYDTSPRMTLSRNDVYEREDTCIKKRKVLINVGGLVHDKAQAYLLEAFSDAKKTNKNLFLKIIGEGPLLSELKSKAEQLGIVNSVEFVGYVEDEKELYQYLIDADIFVLSSVTEGFPRVLYEAMAHRLPIVTTDVGGIPFLMKDGLNARVIKSGDVDALSEAIIEVVEDAKLRKKIIKESAKTLENIFVRINPAQISDLLEKHSGSKR